MKVVFMGVSHRRGISKKTNKPYDMNQFHFAASIEPIDTPNMSFSGYGYQEQTVDIDPLCIDQFHSIKPFTQIDVVIEPKPSNFSQTWVVGINQK